MKIALDPKDVQDFLFKQSSTRQVFNGFKTVPTACNLIATDGKRGLLYVGHENKITVLRCNGQAPNEWKFEHELPQVVSRVALSCDYEYLSITFDKSTARIYNAASLTRNNLELLHEIQLSATSNDVFAYDLKWNPAIPGMFCTLASDHTIGSFMVKVERKTTVGLVALERIEGLEVLCVAWSPKGKQLVVGCRNGNIVQLRPELKVARTITGPSPSVGSVIAILWLSNYQFCATYQDPNDRSIKLLIVDAPKGQAEGIFTCYDDITYGMPENETDTALSRYYLDHVAEWGIIIAASSSSTEVAVLGSHDNGNTWEQWQLVDSGRAQLPLIRTTESYPVGFAVDRSSDEKLMLGPETTLPNPVPVLHIFGTSGQLISFHMVYLTPNCPSLCSPPTEIVTAVQAQAPRPSLGPAEISFNLNTAATSTPRPKQAELPVERPKILPSANLFSEPAKPPPAPAPVQQVELKIPKPRAEKIEAPPPKVEQRLSPVKEVVVPPEKPAYDESLCLRLYVEEQMLFEKELKAKLEPQAWECGTEEEQRKLVTQSAIIDEFLRELRETTNSLSSDLQALTALLLQSFAWLEETKSKNSANSTDNPRDRGDRNKIKELQKSFFNIQSQLIQATKALDMEWTDHESRGKSKIEIPRLEFIYQSLKSHSEIIAKEKSLLDQQLRKWKALTRGNKATGLNRSMAKLNISSSHSPSGKHADGGAIELRCKAFASNTRSFSLEKQLKLQDLLLQTKPRVIKAITPSPVQDRLEATLSSLASMNPLPNLSKSKPERVSAERVVSSDPIIPKSTPQPSPLASLNSIVAKFGPASTNEPAIQSKPQNKPFSISNTTTPFFAGTSLQVDKKTPVTPLTQTKPKQTITVSLNPTGFGSQMPSNPRTQAFSEVQSISFGTPVTKTQDQPAATITSDVFSKGIKSPVSKETNFTISGSTFFQDSSPKPTPSLSSGLTITRSEPQNVTSPVAAKTSYPVLPQGTTIQEVRREPAATSFSFASSGQLPMAAKSLGTVATPPTSSLQSFSFASKPTETPAFSFALKDSTPASQPPAPGSSDLPTLLGLDLGSTGSNQPSVKPSMPTSTITFGGTSSAAAAPIVSGPPATSQPAPRSESLSTPPTTTTIFGNAATSIPATTISFGKVATSAPSSSIFGGNAATPAAPTSIFGGGTSGLSSSLFGGLSTGTSPSLTPTFNVAQTTATTASSGTPAASTAPSLFGNAASTATSTPAKPATEPSGNPGFGKSPINFASPNFGGMLGAMAGNRTTPQVVNFGTAAAASPPAYDKAPAASAAASVFSQTPVASAAATNLVKTPATTAATNLFGGNTATPTGGSVFGSMSGNSGSTIFGGGTANAAAPSAFEGASTPMAPFGSSATIFGGGVQKSPTSVFGGGTATPMSAFGGAATQAASPTGPGSPQAAPAFGQAPAFGAKPVFGGQASVFGAAKPEFSNPFGGSTFGAAATGFSSPPAMGASPPPLGTASMQKVFGNPGGTSTFESLAGQNGGLSFGSLAQETQPEPQKPQAFSGGSSFSSWR